MYFMLQRDFFLKIVKLWVSPLVLDAIQMCHAIQNKCVLNKCMETPNLPFLAYYIYI